MVAVATRTSARTHSQDTGEVPSIDEHVISLDPCFVTRLSPGVFMNVLVREPGALTDEVSVQGEVDDAETVSIAERRVSSRQSSHPH